MNRLSRQCWILDISQPCASTACYRDSFTFYLVAFIVYSVSFIVCVALCAVFYFSVVCYFVWYVYFSVLCLIVVPLPSGKILFADQLNNNNNLKTQRWVIVKFILVNIGKLFVATIICVPWKVAGSRPDEVNFFNLSDHPYGRTRHRASFTPETQK
jgi:hypothetical protein